MFRYSIVTQAVHVNRQRGREGKDLIVLTTLCCMIRVNLYTGDVVTSLDKTLYNDSLCLVASNKQQIHWTRIPRIPQEH